MTWKKGGSRNGFKRRWFVTRWSPSYYNKPAAVDLDHQNADQGCKDFRLHEVSRIRSTLYGRDRSADAMDTESDEDDAAGGTSAGGPADTDRGPTQQRGINMELTQWANFVPAAAPHCIELRTPGRVWVFACAVDWMLPKRRRIMALAKAKGSQGSREPN